MSLWRQVKLGVRGLLGARRRDDELLEELDHYLAEATAAHRARGLSPAAAARAARLEIGGETAAAEEARGYGWERAVAATAADVRHAARRLRREPGVTALALVTVALAVGATTAIWSAVRPILVEPLPYAHGDRIVTLWEETDDGSPIATSFATASTLAERSHSLAMLAMMDDWHPALTGGGRPERLTGQRVSASYFDLLAVRPRLGRAFTAADDRPGAPRVALLADGLWRRRFGADPHVLGRSVRLDGVAHTIVGVLPPRFENVAAPQAVVWTPLRYDLTMPGAFGHHVRALGRLRAAVPLAAARRELTALMPVLQRELPDAHPAAAMAITPLQEEVARGVRPALLAVAGAVLLLLLLACVNLTHLLLARGVRRRGELAVRVALGAGRVRIVRQLLVESVLLALPGGLLGVALAALVVRVLVALSPLALPRAAAIVVDRGVLAFGVLLTLVVGIAFGLAPALHAVRRDLQPALRLGGRRTTRGTHARGRLVVVEVALALVLLVGSGLLLRSVRRLLAIAPGFDARGVAVLQVDAADARFADATTARAFFASALEAVRRLPGARAAAWTSQLPLSGDDDRYGARTAPALDGSRECQRYAVSPGYFAAMGIPLRGGRVFDGRDRAGGVPVAILGASFARRLFPRGDALGQRVQVGGLDTPWMTVVGIVGDVRQRSLAGDPAEAIYLPAEQSPFDERSLWLVMRGAGDPTALARAGRDAVWSVDRDQPVSRLGTLQALVAASAAQQRFALALFALFAVVALLLGAAGIYGVLAGSVAERRREIGVRSALGAAPRALLGGVVHDGLRLAGAGAALGLLGAMLATRALSSLLFGVTRFDPATYGAVLALLALVASVACAIPAWRAARIDPATTLREE